MREIKFRVFSKDEGDYYYAEKGNEVEIKFSEDSFTVWVEVQEWESGSGEWVDSYVWRELEGEKVLEQFTGLLDKNGVVELFEGDIVDIKGNIKGNIHENEATGNDIIIPSITGKDWNAAYKEAVGRGCKHAK